MRPLATACAHSSRAATLSVARRASLARALREPCANLAGALREPCASLAGAGRALREPCASLASAGLALRPQGSSPSDAARAKSSPQLLALGGGRRAAIEGERRTLRPRAPQVFD